MARKTRPPVTLETAWQQLQGIWVYRQGDRTIAGSSWVESWHQFTPDRRWMWVNLLAGGIIPGIQRNEWVTEITGVAIQGEDILLTLGKKSDPQAQPGGVMTVRFRNPHRLIIEDGPALSRVADPTAWPDAE